MKSAKKIIPREKHSISRTNISEHALKVLYRLRENGYQAYLVGGGVRDLLLKREPKDFDVATDANPDDIKKIFRNCRLIGRRFRLAHVYFNKEIIEVATFRSNNAMEDDSRRELSDSGMIIRDNVYGSMEEDAWRRDFTINALYYDISNFSIIDFTGAIKDLKKRILRLIGDPEQRYREDPVRMLRAVRFSAKLELNLHRATEAPIIKMHHLLNEVSTARLFEETLKLFHGGHARETFDLLRKLQLFKYLFPQTEEALNDTDGKHTMNLLQTAFKNTDERIRDDKPVTPAFLFAILLWKPLLYYIETYCDKGHHEAEARDIAIEKVIEEQIKSITIPRRFSSMMRDIWKLQYRLPNRQGNRAYRILSHKRFRAAYDFLVIRAEHDPELLDLARWWTEFQYVSEKEKTAMIKNLKSKSSKTKRRKINKAANND